MLKNTFITLLSNYSSHSLVTGELWQEIEKSYSQNTRHYHTLSHLEDILHQLLEVREIIQDWDAVLFALYYHDIIYSPLKSDNEKQSAALAAQRMSQVDVPWQRIERCEGHILATKEHLYSSSSDTNYFTDADLAILGQDLETYKNYARNVRKEYSIFPDLIYNPGRKKVLRSFLERDRIYKTPHFFDKFELQAKYNLNYEMDIL